MRNALLTFIAAILIVLILFHGLAHAWMALGVLKFVFIVVGVLVVGILWGHFTRK